MQGNKFVSSAAAIFIGALFMVGEASSNPPLVPVPPAPLSCTTPSGGWTITLVSNSMTGPIPFPVPCLAAANSGNTCSNYKYNVVGPTPDHVVFAISADQDLDTVRVNSSVVNNPSVTPPGSLSGDQPTGFLFLAQHEYPVRVNPTGNPPNTEFLIVGRSAPRISTVLVKKGKLLESCLIAGPGVPGDAFQPVFQSQRALVAGGKCLVDLVFDGNGNVVDVQNVAGSSCIRYEGPVTVTIGNNTGPLKNNTSPHGLTFGNGTTTCYGPPIPSTPRCICTQAPCP